MTLSHTFIAITFSLLLVGCGGVDYETMAEQRVVYAQENQGDIVIAAIQGSSNSHYINGISLAIEEINQSKHGLLKRPLKLQIEQGHHDLKSIQATIRRITSNPKISALLGHTNDNVVLPASTIYEKSKIIFFPPSSTTEKLTSHSLQFTFRMIPDNQQMVKQILMLSKRLKFNKIGLLYAHNKQYSDIGLLIMEIASKLKSKLAYSQSFFKHNNNYQSLLFDLKKENLDATIIIANANTAAKLIKQMRKMGINHPVLGTAELNSTDFTIPVGLAGNNTIIPTAYNLLADNPINRHFITRYKEKYNHAPDADAAQGYDSVMLFANKVSKTQSTLPTLLASTLHFSPPWRGVAGIYQFDRQGNLIDKNYFFQVLTNKKWRPFTVPPIANKTETYH